MSLTFCHLSPRGAVFIYPSSLVAQMVKNMPAMRETWVRSLGREDPWEEGLATHSSIISWRTHGQRSLAGHSSWGRKQSDICDWVTKDSTGLSSTLISGTKLIGRRRQDNKKATQAKHSQTRALLTEVPAPPVLKSQVTNHFCSLKSWYSLLLLTTIIFSPDNCKHHPVSYCPLENYFLLLFGISFYQFHIIGLRHLYI